MDLILWRHAEAEPVKTDQPEARRSLSPRGRRQAEEMAAWLRNQPMRECRVLVSPTTRCVETAEALNRPFDIQVKMGLSATATDLLVAADWPDFHGAVILVSHQPALGRLASLLLAGQEADWTIKKGGIWWFSNRVKADESQTILKAVTNPVAPNIRMLTARETGKSAVITP